MFEKQFTGALWLFSDVHQFWCERMSEIGRRTVSVVNLGSRGIAHTSEPGRPKFVTAGELLENLRSLECTLRRCFAYRAGPSIVELTSMG